VSQRRAVCTRERVLRAAANEIVRSGYHGTTLAHVAERAHVTPGAVSFHFPTKQALVQEVYRDGMRRMSESIEDDGDECADPLQGLADLTLHVASLLIHEDDLALACSRLSRDDLTGCFDWPDTWRTQVARLADRACGTSVAAAGCSSETLRFLVHCLLRGVEIWAMHPGWERPTVLRHLAAAWQQAMPGGRMEL
jgi:AcrR family transcriptional regulator